jgi:predicted RNA-binding Zn-ribbon protein involved in translation (DUF1610 family)
MTKQNGQHFQQTRFETEGPATRDSGPVTCLGLTFPNDEERRKHFLGILREKLKDPEFRKIEGFPIGSDEDILALSDPPYYTACPNPFIADFIKHYGKPYDPSKPYSREPFAADVSEGKNDPIYNAHSYHTKVPHKAIMRYILHYTEPGDVVFDGFCGTGMTGVAAQMCGDRAAVESLGYRVDKDGTIYQQEAGEDGKAVWRPFSKLGARRAILNDLSPAATFIAYNYNTPVDVEAFEREAKRILKEVEDECGWMYATLARGVTSHGSRVERQEDAIAEEWADKLRACKTADEIRSFLIPHSSFLGTINYTVWSDVFICPECTREVVFWEAAVDKTAGKVHDEFPCPHCGAMLTKRRMERAWVTKNDPYITQSSSLSPQSSIIRQAKQVPVLINYSVGKKRFEKAPDAFDLALIEKIEQLEIPYWFPTDRMPEGYNTEQPKVSHGLTHVHHFYTRRNLWVLAAFWGRIKDEILLVFQSVVATLCSRLVRYNMGNRGNGPLSGTLYVSSMIAETNPVWVMPGKVSDFSRAFTASSCSIIGTYSTSAIDVDTHYVDYIFTDPPFGGNLMYSELNFLWEAWLKVFTNNKPDDLPPFIVPAQG